MWQKGDLFLFYHSQWNTWFVADQVVPQEPRAMGEDPWASASCLARISGIEFNGEPVPGGDVYIPWFSNKPLEGFRLMSKGNFVVEMVNELWDHYQKELCNSQELKDQIGQLQLDVYSKTDQNLNEQQLHARELAGLQQEKEQQSQHYGRELQQLQQQLQAHAQELHQLQQSNAQEVQQLQELQELRDKVAKQEDELQQLKHKNNTLERQLNLVQVNTAAGMKGAPFEAPGGWWGGQPPGPPPGMPPQKGVPGASGCPPGLFFGGGGGNEL